jgi:hypothetical protein
VLPYPLELGLHAIQGDPSSRRTSSAHSLEAAKKPTPEGIRAEVINMATIKPPDEEPLLLSPAGPAAW